MARPPARGKAAARGRAPVAQPMQGGLISPSTKLWMLLTAIALVPFSLPTLFLMVCGMLPTMAAAIVGRGSSRGAWMAVGGLNFAGLSPSLVRLWFNHHTMTYAWELVASVFPLLMAYGASGVGWAIHLSMPPLVGAVMSVTSQRRLGVLLSQQKKLVEQWGEDVVTKVEQPKPTLDD